MIKNNILLTLVSLLLLSACATYTNRYRDDVDQEVYPEEKEIERTFYLIGDAGNAELGQSTEGLLIFKKILEQANDPNSFAIFLGDNIYPVGMPPENSTERALAEHRIDAQVETFENFKGTPIIIPGNHDWYNDGLNGLSREEEYIKEITGKDDIFLPRDGCPLVSYDVSDEVHLILIDTQWYLEDWNKNPKINDKCDNIKDREKFFIEFQNELKKNQQKTVIIAMHHPMFTNGVHGGKFALDKHLYPSQQKLPLPILASLVTQVRTQGGVSKQDRFNEKYNELMKRLRLLAQDVKKSVFVSGHEHGLQYIEHEEVRQIVSGSGSKSSYAFLGNDGLFSSDYEGFARLDIFKDGSSFVRYYGADQETGELDLFFQKQVYAPDKLLEYSNLTTEYDTTVQASVYTIEETERSDLFENVWGEQYRDVYGKKVTVPVAILDTLYGGLKVIRPGGGNQTTSLRLEDKDGREYNMRSLRKSGVQFLQNTVLKQNEDMEEDLENSLPRSLIQDFYTAAHPYGAFAIPTLSKAARVLSATPELFYVPKQPALGIYNADYGDELYMIVERPAEEFDGAAFNYPDDIESTDDILDKIRSDEENVVDEVTYIRARMFDMLIGDWDRDNDQWRWAEYKDQNGKDVFVPIPRDRDQVFTNFDGTILNIAQTLFGAAKQFQAYDKNLKDIKWFNKEGIKLDRALAQQSGSEVWLEQARFLQNQITDAVIEEAFNQLPEEVQGGESISSIKENLKGRRDNIVEIAETYYEYLAELQMVTGTDKDDYFEITRGNNQTTVKAWRIKGGEKADLLINRTYYSDETNQLWIYGLDDDDVFEVNGTGNNPIFIRIIGGQNNDVYRIYNGREIKVYDHETLPNTIESRGGANFRLTDVYDYNTYDYKKDILRYNVITPAIGYNPDNGLTLGLSDSYTVNGFKQNPYSQQHRFKANYFFATHGLDLNYEGEFAGILNDWNLVLHGRYATPNYTRNFFGFGNESVNPDEQQGYDYNRVRMSVAEVSGGLLRNSDYGSTFSVKALLQSFALQENALRFIEQANVIELEEAKYFASLDATYEYHSKDNSLAPTRGMDFILNGGFTNSLTNTGNRFLYLNPSLGFYNALSANRKLVLKTTARAQFRFGDNYEFYQGASLGENNNLRGYRFDRYIGGEAFTTSADLRYGFDTFKTGLIPLQIGIFTGYDVGRVWYDGDAKSEKWHDSYGLGFWVNSTDALSGTFNMFRGSEGFRVSFGFGFNF